MEKTSVGFNRVKEIEKGQLKPNRFIPKSVEENKVIRKRHNQAIIGKEKKGKRRR